MQSRKFKPRVLVALGWNDPRTVLTIGHYARDAGWHLETRQFFDDDIPRNWRGEGLIVSSPKSPGLLKFIRKQAPLQPTVQIWGNRLGIRAPRVLEDNVGAGRLAAMHFLDRGHKHFAWVGLHPGEVATDRYGGFRAALNEAGFECHVLKSPAQGNFSAKLQLLPRPLACYVLDDQLASDLLETSLILGLRVPEDIAVMGTGNIEIACECSHVPISSIDLGEEEIARRTAELLDQLMRGGKPPANPIVIAPRGVVTRKSTEFLAVTDPVLKTAVDYIAGHLDSLASLDQIAAMAGVSRSTLYNLFRRDLRRTPAEFVDQLRFANAKQLLAKERLTLSEAARRCGFGSGRTLSRHFIDREGVSAHEWSKRQHS